MEEYITVTAKTVKDAILEASLNLETFRDNIEYEVIEEGSTGFLGFGSKKAIIKARKKVAVEDILKEEVNEEKPAQKEKREFKKEKINRFKRFFMSNMLFNFISKPDFISYDVRALPNKRIEKIRHKKIILGWTIRDKETFERVQKYCDNFICENIEELK